MHRILLPLVTAAALTAPGLADPLPKIPRFSVEYMDRSVSPGTDFYRFAAGNWVKNNPVPLDKARWSGFEELQERNWALIHAILDDCAAGGSSALSRQVGDFYTSFMQTNRLNELGFSPLQPDLKKIAALKRTEDLPKLLADLHLRDLGGLLNISVQPDAKQSTVYALYTSQGGLSLPDRDYYLSDKFAKQREAYQAYVVRMLKLAGQDEATSTHDAATILEIETALAKASKSRVELRDPNANYNKKTLAEVGALTPAFAWPAYLRALGVKNADHIIVGQPAFLTAVQELLQNRPVADWQTYLRWHVVNASANFLGGAAEEAQFAFYGTTLRGQPQQEPRWQRAAKLTDASIGEALGQLYVQKHFPPAARARMLQLIADIKAVFKDRLAKLEWMTDATRAKALTKFDRFTQKIGHPDTFRDYRSIKVKRDDLLGNVHRATLFENRRQLARIGKTVDRTEWHMTPQTVNAYFNPLQNEIVFPAGILQPPFFDVELDDAVNYGAIGVVIGHEITHGYDDQGRKFDAEGNLVDWWTEADGKEFDGRAKKVIDQYAGYEALPGLKVNGELTLGENIADLGGTSIAYEALQRALARDPSKRKAIDGFSPEQRFFLSLAQLWRVNWREEELRRRVTVDPHSPAQFRAIGPHVNLREFYDAFGIKEGDPMWRPVELRAKIW